MIYESIDGRMIDTNANKVTLRFLHLGDKFKTKAGNHIYEVWDDKCKFNGSAGSATRKCKNLSTGQYEHKLCRIEVIKLKF